MNWLFVPLSKCVLEPVALTIKDPCGRSKGASVPPPIFSNLPAPSEADTPHAIPLSDKTSCERIWAL